MRTASARAVLVSVFFLAATDAFGEACEALAGTRLPHTTVSIAQPVPEGTFKPPYGNALEKLPAFCRVAGVIKPTADSYIRFETWMPASGWNGKFLGVGNGGFAGSIDYKAMGGNLKRGYATAATDTGHEAEAVDASWAFHHPEKVADFGYRALHETVVNAKSLVHAFYGNAPHRSYFDSCSDGGREALMEAQRFPEDFDGILAGAPANFWTHLVASGVDTAKLLYAHPEGYVSGIKLPAINAAVLAACDAEDGVKDGIIGDPTRCHFDPGSLLCKGPDSRTCLTAPQIASLTKLYTGGQNSRGQQIFPGFVPGAELGQGGWGPWIIGPGPGGSSGSVYVENYFRYMVFEDPAWNPITANPDTAERTADKKTATFLNATDPDLRRFHARGGKLILYHGWNDPAISPWNTINYYKSVVAAVGASEVAQFVRLYMVPGMQHCMGGPGASSFGQLGSVTAKGPDHGIYTALEQWVEGGAAPGGVIATKYVDDNSTKGVEMTRPLCAYPQVANYKGSGDTHDSTSFACSETPAGH
jgi:hypothetical protein